MRALILAVFIGSLTYRGLEMVTYKQNLAQTNWAKWVFYGGVGNDQGFRSVLGFALTGTLVISLFLFIFRSRGLVRA